MNVIGTRQAPGSMLKTPEAVVGEPEGKVRGGASSETRPPTTSTVNDLCRQQWYFHSGPVGHNKAVQKVSLSRRDNRAGRLVCCGNPPAIKGCSRPAHDRRPTESGVEGGEGRLSVAIHRRHFGAGGSNSSILSVIFLSMIGS
jgi:hypothetical protein